jgi:hypothetical protein
VSHPRPQSGPQLVLQRIDSLPGLYPTQVSLPDIPHHGVQHSHHLEAVARIAGDLYCLPFRHLEQSVAADRMRGGRNSGAGIAAVVGEEGSFGPVEERLAVGEGEESIERSLAGRVESRMAGVRIAAGLHNFVR